MYSFRQIRAAVLAGGRDEGFPHGGAFAPERLAALRNAPHVQTMMREARDDVQQIHGKPIPTLPFSSFKLFEQTGSRREFEQVYFARRGQLLALTITAVIDQTDETLSDLEDLIWAICDEYTWCLPAHLRNEAPSPRGGRLTPERVVDLFAAETSHALAETITLLQNRLHPWISERVRVEVERRIFQPLFHDPTHFFWESVPMNWASVCAGASGMAALLLVDDAERLAGMVERCCRAMECFMEGFGADGGCAEGIGYWQYGFGYYVYFSEMLRDYTHGALDLLDNDLARQVAAFPAGVNLGGESFVNYSDGQARNRIHLGLISRLAGRLGSPLPELNHTPSLHDDHAYRWPHVTRDIVWTNPQVIGQRVPDGTRFFDDLQWVVDRRHLGSTTVAFSARGGNNGEPHNQNDLGHFILQLGNESLLADLGAGLYTRQYFGPTRYDHIHNSSEGHSVPFINGQTQSTGTEFRATILRYDTHEHGLTFALDLTGAYTIDSLQRCERVFEWNVDPAESLARLDLSDSFTFSTTPNALEEMFISLHRPEIDAASVSWRGQQGSVTLSFDPDTFEPTLESIESHDHHNNPIVVQRLRFRARRLAPSMTCRWSFVCHTTA